MSHLDEALRGLREGVDGKSPQAEETRRIVVANGRSRANKFRYLTLLAAAALFMGSAAWAGYGGRIREWFATKTASLAPSASTVPEVNAPPSTPSTSPEASAAVVLNDSNQVTISPSTRPSASVKSAPIVSTEELEAYEKAHRAHFGRDPTALLLWDAYLQKYPSGKWQPEARYNRAICLLRSGQMAAARSALEPFARGDFGSYRQNEARALLRSATADAGAGAQP